MSEMEFFHGYFKQSDRDIDISDTDDFYDLEEKLGVQFVKVNGVLYEFWGSDIDADAYGFAVVAPKSEHNQLMCLWYNGGAGLHDVVSDAISSHVGVK